MTGFRLKWFIQDINGTQMKKSTILDNWKPIVHPRFTEHQSLLLASVKRAHEARLGNLTRAEIEVNATNDAIKRAVNYKFKIGDQCCAALHVAASVTTKALATRYE